MRKFKTNWYDRPLSEYIGGWERNTQPNAEIGIEIEVEGQNLPTENITGWVIHQDGSLRGESAEYVFRIPEARSVVPTRLQLLAQRFTENASVINQSYRTSIHVHMNVRNHLIKHIYNNIFLYIIFEDILANMAGPNRIGNLFCLRAKDAEYFLEMIRQAIVTDELRVLANDNLRYSAVNPAAMWRHGSLEFRSFRGTVDMDLIQQWVDVLCAIRDAAQRYNNPIEIVQDLSIKGPQNFMADIFGPELMKLFPNVPDESIQNGVRLIQHAAFGHDWSPMVVTDQEKKSRNKKTQYDQYVEQIINRAPPRRGGPAEIRFVEAPPQQWVVAPQPDWVVAADNILDEDNDDDDDGWNDERNEEEV